MASSIQLLRSAIARERPLSGSLLEGQPAVNINPTEPGLFFKATDGSIVKIGPAAITSDGSPPNTDPSGGTGNSIGELWLDKSVNPAVLKVYDGSAWIDAGSGGGGGGGTTAFMRWIYTASGGETSLSGSSGSTLLNYTPGLEEVFVNGVLMTRGSDYIAINGSSITNLQPLTTGDAVTVTSYIPASTVQLPGQVSLIHWYVQATSGQTVLSGVDSSGQQLTYTPGLEEVYVNGAFLRRGLDYTATSGSSITMSSPLVLGDEVTVMIFSPFNVGALSITNADVASNAAIAQSKLNLAITNSEVASNAAIAQSKLDLAITNSEVASNAAIAQSKLDLAITNSEVASNAAITSNKLEFTHTRSGAVARTVRSRLTERISVKDFGAVGNGTADDTTAIQTAINSSVGRVVYFPAGVYQVYGTITISLAGVTLEGDGPGTTFIRQQTSNTDTFLFKPTTAGSTSDFLDTVGIRGLTVTHGAVAATSTSGAGVRFLQCNGYKLFDMTVSNAPEGVTIQGGQLGSLKSFQVFAAQGLSPTTDTSLLYFRQAPVGAGFQPCYTVEVEDFRLGASLLRESCILIQNADGLGFSNAYVAQAGSSLVKVKNERDNSYIGAVSFVNVYLDCVGAGRTPTAIDIPADGFAGSNVYDVVIGSGCFLGNGDDYGILCRKPQTRRLSLKGATVVNFGKWAVDCESSTFSTDLHIEGCSFNNVGDSTSGAIRAANGNSLNITGNVFGNSIENVCINVSGSWNTGTITGNTNSSNIADLLNTATFTGSLAVAGNSSRNAGSANSWRGLRVGNTDVTDANTLDWYVEGTWTPAVEFGGSSTGVTYSSAVGTYTRIGNRVLFNCHVTLSSKGSASGTLKISGLPFTASSTVPLQSQPVLLDNVAGDFGQNSAVATIAASSNEIGLSSLNVTGATETRIQADNTNLTNVSTVSVTGSYLCA